MPRIFDNLNQDSKLLPALQDYFDLSSRADSCAGYFNLRGWGGLASYVDQWEPDDGPCRVLIGMQRPPHEELREALSLLDGSPCMDNRAAHRLRRQLRVSMDSKSPWSFDLLRSGICWGYLAMPARLSFPEAISGGSEVNVEQNSLGIRNG